MADCDITSSNNNATNDLTPAFTSSSLDSENIGNSNANVPNDGKKRKTHRLKQRFQVVKKLGQGTYGKVQLAINNETGQEVAIKTIKKNKVSNQQDLIRIRREIQIMSSINHPNIIHIFEVFENKDKIVLVMQYASGGELYDYVSFHKALSDDEARRVFRQVATAIYYCHKNKICHRDLKLENILLDEKGNAKIADFGLSNVFDDKHFLQTFCGSPLYASPEIVRGLPYFGPEVDCWSLGVLLYTLVYGAMPFDGSNFKKLVKQISEANYFEPPEKSPATDLIHKLLTPEPKERASIIDICIDPWVNQDCEHSLLQVAEDMSNLTNHAVRLDMLLALAPGSQPTEQQPEEETVKQDEDLKAAAVDDDLSKKRPKETSSANDSLLDIAKKSTKKKSKKAASNKTAEPIEQPQQSMDEATVKPNEQEQLVKPSIDDKMANIQHEKQAPTVVEDSEMKTQSQSSLKSAESSSSMKRRGRVSIPDIWDDNQTKQAVNDDSGAQSPKKEPKSLGLQSSISQLNKDLEQRTKSAESLKSSSSSITKKSSTTIPDTKNDSKQPQQQSIENVDDSSSNKVDANEESKSIAADQINNEMNEQKSAKNVDDSTEKGVETTSSQSSIKDENKSLAKQIIQKNIAKAKLMEKRQTSVQSNNSTTISGGGLQSGETTPLISIENSTISMLRQDSIGSSKNTFFSDAKTDKSVGQKSSVAASTKTDTNLILNPAPISRSYKKVIFTKDGAKITETGKFYSHEGDGFTTRVEKTSRITISGGGGVSSINDNTNNSSSTLQRSDSQDSTGSLDIFDDIFDDHWTDQLFSNARSLFNDFFGRRSDRLNLRSRAESLERSNFFNDDRFRSRDPFKAIDDFRNDSFASEKSLFNKKSIFNTSSSSASSFLKSSLSGSGKLNKSIFDDNDDDDNDGFMIGKKSSQSRMNDLREKYGLNRFSSGDNHNNQQQQMFNSSTTNNRMNRLFDSNDHLETQRKTRIDQWLDNNSNENVSEQFKEFNNCMNTYGTISRPSRLNMRPMMMTTSNDSLNLNLSSKHQNVKTDIIKRVEMTDSSTTCQVIRHKKTQMNDDLKITPKDIQFNFKLDDKTGSLILNNANIIIPNQSSTLSTSSSLSSTTQQQQHQHQYHQQQSKSSSATTIIEGSSNKIDDLKIEEPSSLLEKLRTVGYKKLVDRRLSDAASDDLPAPGGSASNSSKMTDKSSSKTSNESSANH